MNITRLRRRAARQPAALRVLAAARRRGLEIMAINGRFRYDVHAEFDAGLLGELVTYEVAIIHVLERRLRVLDVAARANVSDVAVGEPARRLDGLGTTRAAAIRGELEIDRR